MLSANLSNPVEEIKRGIEERLADQIGGLVDYSPLPTPKLTKRSLILVALTEFTDKF